MDDDLHRVARAISFSIGTITDEQAIEAAEDVLATLTVLPDQQPSASGEGWRPIETELEWDTAPLGEVLWGVYGPDSFPSVFACKILEHPGQGRVLWGFSIYRRSPGFRTLGVSSLWAEQHGLHLFRTQAGAFAFIASLFAKAVQP